MIPPTKARREIARGLWTGLVDSRGAYHATSFILILVTQIVPQPADLLSVVDPIYQNLMSTLIQSLANSI